MEVPTIPDTWRWRLAEAIAWGRIHASLSDPQRSLRTPTLQPPDMDIYTQPPPPGYTNWLQLPLQTRAEISKTHMERIVDNLGQARADHLRRDLGYPLRPAHDLAGGRLLLYAPGDNLADGAAEIESHGFFDVNNAPAWDTWVWYEDGGPHSPAAARYSPSYLISWIPPEFLDLVAAGIAVNPEECILWAEDTDIRFTAQLRAAGFLSP